MNAALPECSGTLPQILGTAASDTSAPPPHAVTPTQQTRVNYSANTNAEAPPASEIFTGAEAAAARREA